MRCDVTKRTYCMETVEALHIVVALLVERLEDRCLSTSSPVLLQAVIFGLMVARRDWRASWLSFVWSLERSTLACSPYSQKVSETSGVDDSVCVCVFPRAALKSRSTLWPRADHLVKTPCSNRRMYWGCRTTGAATATETICCTRGFTCIYIEVWSCRRWHTRVDVCPPRIYLRVLRAAGPVEQRVNGGRRLYTVVKRAGFRLVSHLGGSEANIHLQEADRGDGRR